MWSAGGLIGAHDVVIEHAADGVALILQPFDHVLGAHQALLFARDGGKEQRRAILRWAG